METCYKKKILVRNPKYSKLNDTFEIVHIVGNDVEIAGARPVHPQNRMERKIKNLRKKHKATVDISEVLKKSGWQMIFQI